jgi:hypothetical protein
MRSTARALSSKVACKTQLMRTNVPSIFTTANMDPDMGLSRFGAEAKTLFGPNARSEYLSPIDMNYKLPTNGAPEFAFVGRSNVGKSSLVDLLLGGRKIVRVSKEPGCTRSINYYGIAKNASELAARKEQKDFSSYLVDLPGYGFAKKSKSEQLKWKGIINSYLRERNQSVLRYGIGAALCLYVCMQSAAAAPASMPYCCSLYPCPLYFPPLPPLTSPTSPTSPTSYASHAYATIYGL